MYQFRFRTRNSGSRRVLSPRAGLTLLEMMVGLLVSSILMTGIGSAIYISLQGVRETTKPSSPISETAGALNQVQGEMSHALRFTERTNTAATFQVPDRDANGTPETVRFAWSGVAGDPLTRTYNGGSPATVIDGVNHFDLAYPLRDMIGTEPVSLVNVEGAEQTHIFHKIVSGGSFWGIKISGSTRIAQEFQVPFVANVVSWTITKIEFLALTEKSLDGTLRVEITTKDLNGNPSTTPLSYVDIPESSFSNSPTWTPQISIPPVRGLTAGQELFLVLRDIGSGSSGRVVYQENGSPMTPLTHYRVSTDGGSSWSSPNNTTDLLFYIYGTYTTEEAL